MKFKDLYERGLDRKVNPAVSASDLSEETVHTEIEEYVFTQEIIVNLYNILTNIRLNQGSHVGIWINGYYGSGKSHFLKYASYCLSGKYSKKAFERLIDATQQMLLGDKDISALEIAGVSLSDLRDLQNWYENKADVEMVMFNIGDVHDANVDRANTFTTIFWNSTFLWLNTWKKHLTMTASLESSRNMSRVKVTIGNETSHALPPANWIWLCRWPRKLTRLLPLT